MSNTEHQTQFPCSECENGLGPIQCSNCGERRCQQHFLLQVQESSVGQSHRETFWVRGPLLGVHQNPPIFPGAVPQQIPVLGPDEPRTRVVTTQVPILLGTTHDGQSANFPLPSALQPPAFSVGGQRAAVKAWTAPLNQCVRCRERAGELAAREVMVREAAIAEEKRQHDAVVAEQRRGRNALLKDIEQSEGDIKECEQDIAKANKDMGRPPRKPSPPDARWTSALCLLVMLAALALACFYVNFVVQAAPAVPTLDDAAALSATSAWVLMAVGLPVAVLLLAALGLGVDSIDIGDRLRGLACLASALFLANFAVGAVNALPTLDDLGRLDASNPYFLAGVGLMTGAAVLFAGLAGSFWKMSVEGRRDYPEELARHQAIVEKHARLRKGIEERTLEREQSQRRLAELTKGLAEHDRRTSSPT